MPWCRGLVPALLLAISFSVSVARAQANINADNGLWKEYGLVSVTDSPDHQTTTYQMKDVTGALAVCAPLPTSLWNTFPIRVSSEIAIEK